MIDVRSLGRGNVWAFIFALAAIRGMTAIIHGISHGDLSSLIDGAATFIAGIAAFTLNRSVAP